MPETSLKLGTTTHLRGGGEERKGEQNDRKYGRGGGWVCTFKIRGRGKGGM